MFRGLHFGTEDSSDDGKELGGEHQTRNRSSAQKDQVSSTKGPFSFLKKKPSEEKSHKIFCLAFSPRKGERPYTRGRYILKLCLLCRENEAKRRAEYKNLNPEIVNLTSSDEDDEKEKQKVGQIFTRGYFDLEIQHVVSKFL